MKQEKKTYNFSDSIDDQNQSVENESQQQGQYDFTDDINGEQQEEETFQEQPIVQPGPMNNVPNIPNDNVPFVVLVGPPNSGKSMVLKCLGDYLYNHEELHYTLEADKTLFANAAYQFACKKFDDLIGNVNQAMPNNVDYLMANIIDDLGNVKAHFLEAPGEHFFSINNPAEEPDRPFETYMNSIAQIGGGVNRKVVYIIILDLDSPTSFRSNPTLRRKYQDKMVKLHDQYVVNHPAEVVLLYNKVDIPFGGKWANAAGVNNPKAILADAKRYYPQLFFTRRILWWDVENFTFLPFCTGTYGAFYTPSAPSYPAALWNAITKIW